MPDGNKSGAQSGTAKDGSIKDKLINWVVFVISLAVIPTAARLIMSYYVNNEPIPVPNLFSHGELFLICIAIAADAVGELALKGKTTGDHALSFYTSIFIIILCLCLYSNIGSDGIAPNGRLGFAWFSGAWLIITLITACSCKVLAEK